jgi:hypothetical protein
MSEGAGLASRCPIRLRDRSRADPRLREAVHSKDKHNATMHSLRRCRRLPMLALAWFVLWVSVTSASPVLSGWRAELVCSGTSVKLVAEGTDPAGGLSGHVAQCPGCVHTAAPPPCELAASFLPDDAAPLPIPSAQTELREPSAAPWSARGPPLTS